VTGHRIVRCARGNWNTIGMVVTWASDRSGLAWRWLHARRRSVLVAFALSVSLTLVSIRDFLFGSGYYEYSDQQWQPNGAVYPSGFFSPSPLTSNGVLYPLQFSRDFVTFPIGLFHLLSLNSLLQEKLFFLYSFILFLVLAYVFAALIVRYALKTLQRTLSAWKTELARVLIVLALFTNLYFIFLTVDGGTVTENLIGIFIGISALLLLAEEDFLKALACAVVLSSLGFLLDPADAVTVLVVLGLAVLFRSFLRRESLRSLFANVGQLLLASIPTVVFLAYFFYPTLGHGASGGGDYPVRPFSLSGIQGFAGNTTLPNVLRLTGYTWDTVTLAPPSILWYHGAYYQLPGLQSPTTILIVPGGLTQVWLFTLFAPVVIAFASLLIPRLRSLTIPFGVILLTCMALTQWPWFPPAASVVSSAASLPLLGPLLGEALYFPYFFMLGESVAILVLSGSLVVALLAGELRFPYTLPSLGARSRRSGLESSSSGSNAPSRSTGPFRIAGRIGKYALVGAVAILLVLPGWQALDGSYFPSRAWSPYVDGNGVPNAGPFEPLNVPVGVDALYNYLYAQPGNFNIYWPSGGANATDFGRAAFFFNSASSPKPMAPLSALPYLVAQADTEVILSYLQSQNVEYIVLQNDSSTALEQEYGLASFPDLVSLFDSVPGLIFVPSLSYPNLTVYRVSQPWGSTYSVSQLLDYSGGNSGYPVAYAVDRALNLTPAILDGSPAATTLSVDTLSGNESILSPGGVQNLTGVGTVASRTLNLPLGVYPTTPDNRSSNFTSISHGLNETLVQMPGTTLEFGNWSLLDWGPSNVSLSIREGTVTWSALGPTTISMNYGRLLTSGSGGVEILSPGFSSSATSLNFSYETSPDFNGTMTTYIRDETTNSSVAQIPLSTLLAPSSKEAMESFGAPTVPWTKYFESCFQATFSSGSVAIALANYSWNGPSLSFAYHVDYTVQSLGSWTLTNWSSPVPMYYSYGGGAFGVSSPNGASTFSLNFGPSLTAGYGGVANPLPSLQGVAMKMEVTYRTSPDFRAQLFNLAAYYQESSSPEAPATGVNGPTIPFSTTLQTVNYSITLSPLTRNFTVRLQAVGIQGSFELTNVTFSWAFLPVQMAAPFGVAVSTPRNETVYWPSRFASSFGEIAGPPPTGGIPVNGSASNTTFLWYRFDGPFTALTAGDQLAAVALFTRNPATSPVATVYTGPFAVDLVLESGGQQYWPYETVDGNALFQYAGSGKFSIVHSAVPYLEAYYLLFLVYLGLLYPVLSYVRRSEQARRSATNDVINTTPRNGSFLRRDMPPRERG
jgi:hypothetical protein